MLARTHGRLPLGGFSSQFLGEHGIPDSRNVGSSESSKIEMSLGSRSSHGHSNRVVVTGDRSQNHISPHHTHIFSSISPLLLSLPLSLRLLKKEQKESPENLGRDT